MTKPLKADVAGLAEAARILRKGGTVAFPTETVYGLGADATDPLAVARIYEAKGRPSFNPLIAHLPDAETAMRHGIFNAAARDLANRFWPGPLTLVVPLRDGSGICDLARAGLDSIGLRVPDHPVAQSLLRAVDRPLAAPSANRSGHVSPTQARHVQDDLDGRIDAVLDGGPCAQGLESTILSCLEETPHLLRAGALASSEIEAALGKPLTRTSPATLLAPGLLASHYAPAATLRLDAQSIRPGEVALLFGPEKPEGLDQAAFALNLSPSADLREAAANLFAYLRRLDMAGSGQIAAMPIPQTGLGEAINDRLRRAAAPRPIDPAPP
jgi:L-threonylcarbamoyladenylate synthase